MNYDVECPYCTHKYELCHDDGSFYEDSSIEIDTCPSCENEIRVSTSIHFYHEAYTADCLNLPNEDQNLCNFEYQLVGWEKDTDKPTKKLFCKVCDKEKKV